MKDGLGLITKIEEVDNYQGMDGYRVTTDAHVILVLIDNGQSYRESWGYLSSDDNLDQFVGAILKEISLADKALNQKQVEQSDYYEGEGGIQFVDFTTNKGVFQLAVYNAHNGYYGHGILVAVDDDVVLNDTL